MGFTWGAGISLIGLGDLARVRGETAEAAARYRESLDHWRIHGDPWGAICGAGRVGGRRPRLGPAGAGRPDCSRRWRRRPRSSAAPSTRSNTRHEDRTLAAARAVLDADAFAAAWAEGRVLSFEAAVDEALRVGPAPPAPAEATGRAAAHGLTPRELEVVRLLAEGRSNREIAAALFVSPRTVDNHVSNLLAKLGVRSGRAAAAEARRLGIV